MRLETSDPCLMSHVSSLKETEIERGFIGIDHLSNEAKGEAGGYAGGDGD